MPSKLASDSIKAELNSLKKLIEESEKYGDFVGASQHKYRQSELERELQEFSLKDRYTDSVALFFGGKPVHGSKGINADFAGRALHDFQEIVSKIFSLTETGSQAKRGPVAFSKSSKLAITGVTKGSFGFILDEITDQQSMVETELRHVVNSVALLLSRAVSQDDEVFESFAQNLDKRSLLAFGKFFHNLDISEATLRLIDGDSEHIFNEYDIKLGRDRIDNTQIEEKTDLKKGELIGFLPEHRKFELKHNGDIIFGLATLGVVENLIC